MKLASSLKKIMLGGTMIALLITGCKKEEETPITPTTTPTNTTTNTQQTQRSTDQSNVDGESSMAMDDANNILMDVSTTRGVQEICGATIDSSLKAQGQITVNYDGTTACGGKIRYGSIIIKLPYDSTTTTITRWSEAGCVAKIYFNNYKVQYVANNKWVKFLGYATAKNVNGGGIVELILGTPIVHEIRADLDVYFDDGTDGEWKIAKTRTFSYNLGKVKVEITGDTTANGYTNVAMWGVTRYDDNFTLNVSTPITYYVYGDPCLFKPKGVLNLYVLSNPITLTYGVDANGAVTTSCPYGYKCSWSGGDVVVAYQ